MRCLPLGTPFLQNLERMQEYLWLVPDHVHYHEDHLLLLVRYLIEAKCWKMQLVVALKDVFKGRQSVHNMPIVVLRVLVHLHTRCAAAHY